VDFKTICDVVVDITYIFTLIIVKSPVLGSVGSGGCLALSLQEV
jgi:hypothetical protein